MEVRVVSDCHLCADKQENLYELLGLDSPYVSSHQIDVAAASMKEKYDPKENPDNQQHYNKIVRANKCLKRKRCRD